VQPDIRNDIIYNVSRLFLEILSPPNFVTSEGTARRANVSRHDVFTIFIGARLAVGHFVYNIYRRSISTLYVNILRHHPPGSS